MRSTRFMEIGRGAALAIAAGTLAGCHTDMWVQPRAKSMQASKLFADGTASRPKVPGTIAQGQLNTDEAITTGRIGGKLVREVPIPVTIELLKRGQDRFNVYCSPCHGQIGDGQGMIARRGLALQRPPANYHSDRLRAIPIGHFFDVMTNGYGAMFSYASRVSVSDRWAIASYVRALQLSQNSTMSDVPPDEVGKITEAASGGEPSPATGEAGH